MKIKKIALLWLVMLFLFSSVSYFFEKGIQAHQLIRSLSLFHDAFGRNVFLLTLNAVFNSILTLLPLSLIYLFGGMGISIIMTLVPKTNVGIIIFQAMIDTLSALPGLLIGLAISAIGRGSLLSVTTATMVMVFPHLIRFFESQILHFKAQTFYGSTEALGATPFHLSIHHLFPELFSLSGAIFPFILSRLLYIETTLSFLGVGKVSDSETWGQLINQGREYILEAPWIVLVSGLPLLLTLWSFHLLTHEESS